MNPKSEMDDVKRCDRYHVDLATSYNLRLLRPVQTNFFNQIKMNKDLSFGSRNSVAAKPIFYNVFTAEFNSICHLSNQVNQRFPYLLLLKVWPLKSAHFQMALTDSVLIISLSNALGVWTAYLRIIKHFCKSWKWRPCTVLNSTG